MKQWRIVETNTYYIHAESKEEAIKTLEEYDRKLDHYSKLEVSDPALDLPKVI